MGIPFWFWLTGAARGFQGPPEAPKIPQTPQTPQNPLQISPNPPRPSLDHNNTLPSIEVDLASSTCRPMLVASEAAQRGAVEWGAVVKVMAHVALSSVKSGTMQKMS